VKANAYGHGLEGVAGALAQCVDMFGVANGAEAEQLRRLAADTDDTVVYDELMALAGRCDATAAAILSHAGGHAGKLTSQLLER